ncbi:hypothetical protein L873DRAFT_1805312, partial [Choiromyces venosus 120613-1]
MQPCGYLAVPLLSSHGTQGRFSLLKSELFMDKPMELFPVFESSGGNRLARGHYTFLLINLLGSGGFDTAY